MKINEAYLPETSFQQEVLRGKRKIQSLFFRGLNIQFFLKFYMDNAYALLFRDH